jgi:DNA-binding LytR/AlgR family response regulator
VIQSIIIEDEKPSARRLNRMLLAHDINVKEMLHSVEESIIWFNNNQHPELIFLDIQLSDGLSFEIFENVDIKSAVIFTTAFDEYALKAFKLNSIDYLLKPIDTIELAEALKKFENRISNLQATRINFNDLRELIVNPKGRDYKKRFSVTIGHHIKLIDVEDIECFFSENKATYAFTKNSRNYCIDGSLEQLELELEPDFFFRINRKQIIHLKAIRDIVSYTNSRLKISLNHYKEHDLIVARDRVRDFKKWIE